MNRPMLHALPLTLPNEETASLQCNCRLEAIRSNILLIVDSTPLLIKGFRSIETWNMIESVSVSQKTF